MNNEEKTQQFLKKSIKEVIWYLMVFLFLFQWGLDIVQVISPETRLQDGTQWSPPPHIQTSAEPSPTGLVYMTIKHGRNDGASLLGLDYRRPLFKKKKKSCKARIWLEKTMTSVLAFLFWIAHSEEDQLPGHEDTRAACREACLEEQRSSANSQWGKACQQPCESARKQIQPSEDCWTATL